MNSRGICAIVPVKDIAAAKQRLAAAVPAHLRAEFVLTMLEDVLDALSGVDALGQIAVVTADPAAAALATHFGARILSEQAHGGHTAVVRAAASRLAAEGWSGVLQVPGDIPAATAAEIARLIASHRPAPSFTIAPSHDEHGSNAVLLSPPDVMPLSFGDDSFYPHLQAARGHGIEPTVVHLKGVARDIDLPADLTAFRRLRSTTRTQAFLDAWNLGEATEAHDTASLSV